MKVIFLDFDGVLYGHHDMYDENFIQIDESVKKERLKQKIKLLGDICKSFDSKIVIESSYKDLIDEDTLETNVDWIKEILDIMKKNDIEVVGRTPNLEEVREDYNGNPPIWKEDEILGYIDRHKEIEYYCVIDDDDLKATHRKSDLDKVRDHLVETIWCGESKPYNEGLQEYHKEEIGKILEKKIDREHIRRI